MNQSDQNRVIFIEDRGNKREEKGNKRGNKKEEQGKSESVTGGRVFNICFQGNQPTIPRLRHLLS